MRDFENNLKHDSVIDPKVLTADANSASVDMAEYKDVAFYVTVGAAGDTFSSSVKTEIEIQDSADNSTFAACADTDITNAVSATHTGTCAVIDASTECAALYACQYLGAARYVRVVINVTGTHSNGTPYSVVALRSGSRNLPVSN